MASEAALSFSVASVVEDVLQQHGPRLKDLDLASRKAEEAGIFPLLFWVLIKIQFLNLRIAMLIFLLSSFYVNVSVDHGCLF